MSGIRNNSLNSLDTSPQRQGIRGWRYPHPYFDVSSTYIPSTVKELFKWCKYLFLSHSEISPAIHKKCSYAITELIYETENPELNKQWRELMDGSLNIRQTEYELLLDMEVYGNAFCSIYFPFDRYLDCPKCKNRAQLDKYPNWVYTEHKFKATCINRKEACEYSGAMIPHDVENKSRGRIGIRRYNPEYMVINQNHFSGVCEYTYRIPDFVRKEIESGGLKGRNRYQVATTPMPFLSAIKDKKDIRFNSGSMFHMRTPSISSEDNSFGTPPLLAVFKDAWLYQTYRKAQEAIALEHVLPLRLLVPESSGSGHAPHMSMNLQEWQNRMNNIIQRYRQDPNAIYTVPFPSRIENIGGDAAALNVHNDMTILRQQIVTGLDMPPAVMQGDAQFSGASVTLRMLENTFISRITGLERFINRFLVPKLAAYAGLEEIQIRHRDFKMADDVQQKQIALNLRQTNTISDQTTLEELGFDYAVEMQRRKKEEGERNSVLMRQMQANAEAQGRSLLITTAFEARAESVRQKAMKESARAAAVEDSNELLSAQSTGQALRTAQNAAGQPVASLPAPPPMPQAFLDDTAANFLKSVPPEMVPDQLEQLRTRQPALARAVEMRQKTISSQTVDMRPMPEQKPPRRTNSPL